MDFIQFCRAHGLIIDSLPPAGAWKRYPTTDHPRTKNGAAKWLGEIGWCQNHATQVDVSVWRPDADAPGIDTARVAAQAAAFEQKMRDGWARAARKAHELVASAKQAEHNYLHFKGFGDTLGLVLPDGSLLVPMRHWRTNDLVGAQVIRWDEDDRTYSKKMLPGMRAKGAVFRIGSRNARETWLVEGYADGLTMELATNLLRLSSAVVVCFSAGNLGHLAKLIPGPVFIYADNDAESKTGQRTAEATGLPWTMSETPGHDVNDDFVKRGIFAVSAKLMALRSSLETA